MGTSDPRHLRRLAPRTRDSDYVIASNDASDAITYSWTRKVPFVH